MSWDNLHSPNTPSSWTPWLGERHPHSGYKPASEWRLTANSMQWSQSFLRSQYSLSWTRNPQVLRNPKITVLNMSHMNSDYTSHLFFNIHFNIIQTPSPMYPKCSLAFRVSDYNLVRVSYLFNACHMSHPSHPPSFYHPNNISLRIWITELFIMQMSPVSRHVLLLSYSVGLHHRHNDSRLQEDEVYNWSGFSAYKKRI
jgi:hypothetical protein